MPEITYLKGADMKPALRYDFRKDAYFLDYGVNGKDFITEQQAKRLVANNSCTLCCDVPRSWRLLAAQAPKALHPAFGL